MDSATVNASHLRSFIERIEKLEEERKAIGGEYQRATLKQQRAGIGEKKLAELEFAASKKSEEKEKEDAMDEDEKALLEYDR